MEDNTKAELEGCGGVQLLGAVLASARPKGAIQTQHLSLVAPRNPADNSHPQQLVAVPVPTPMNWGCGARTCELPIVVGGRAERAHRDRQAVHVLRERCRPAPAISGALAGGSVDAAPGAPPRCGDPDARSKTEAVQQGRARARGAKRREACRQVALSSCLEAPDKGRQVGLRHVSLLGVGCADRPIVQQFANDRTTRGAV
jgi:hypothetical protein